MKKSNGMSALPQNSLEKIWVRARAVVVVVGRGNYHLVLLYLPPVIYYLLLTTYYLGRVGVVVVGHDHSVGAEHLPNESWVGVG